MQNASSFLYAFPSTKLPEKIDMTFSKKMKTFLKKFLKFSSKLFDEFFVSFGR